MQDQSKKIRQRMTFNEEAFNRLVQMSVERDVTVTAMMDFLINQQYALRGEVGIDEQNDIQIKKV